MRGALGIVLSIAIFVAPLTARGETPEERQATAQAIWREAANRYDVGKWDEAIELFLRAYEVWPYPDILFGLCQAHRQLKQFEKAVFYCKSYLRNVPNASNRDQVVGLVRDMEATIAAQNAARDRPPDGARPDGSSPVRDTNHARWYRDPWGWSLLSAGVVLAVIGGAFLYHATDLDDQADDEIDQLKRADLRDRAGDARWEGATGLVFGGGLVVGGVLKLSF